MQEKKLTRKEQAAETKQLLFDTALQLLEEKDFEKITIRDIVKRANVSIGTFYNYYTTKWDVYYETYVISDHFFETTVKPELSDIPEVLDKIYAFFDYYARYSSEITDFKLTCILYNSANKCFDRQSEIGMVPLLISILEEGLEKGVLKSDKSAAELAQFFMISIRGQVYHWCTNDGNYDLRKAVAEHTRLLLQIFI